MNKHMKKGKAAAFLAALLLVCPLTACGNDSSTAEGGSAVKSNAEQADSDSSADASDDTENSDAAEDAENSTADADTSAADASSADKSESSSEDSGSKKSNSSSSSADSKDSSSSSADGSNKTSSGGNNSNTSGGGTSSGNNSGGSSGNGSSGNSSAGGSSSSGGNSSSGGSSASGGTSETSDPEEEDTTEVAKHIYLNGSSATYDGSGIFVNGSTITIGEGGTYVISGTLDNGQIYVNLTDKKKVKLHLDNCSITNKSGSAINCQSAKKLTIKTLAGTVNYLSDGGTHDLDKGAIFSEDTVNLTGEGTLNITGVYAHGVQSDDDIVVNGGTINITSTKSGLHSNDGIEINGGSLFCDGGTNGIKTDGYVTITGGSSIFIGGTREEKGAIYCDGAFTVTGGQFWAIGNTCTTPDASLTTANVVGLMFVNSQPANTVVNLISGGNEIFTMTSPRNFKYVVFSGPSLLSNAEYSVSYGGSCSTASNNYVYPTGSYSGGTSGGTFTAGNAVTFYTVS